ncbi:MAG: twin transmembrane helix small protein [Pseudomonadota bacterium]|nr:twin transmembrane helix small protein [Pseudomonadota bacterium]
MELEALAAVLPMLIFLSLIAVLVVLGVGVIGMLRGGDFNRRYGNKLMRIRVATQGLAILLILLFVVVSRS